MRSPKHWVGLKQVKADPIHKYLRDLYLEPLFGWLHFNIYILAKFLSMCQSHNLFFRFIFGIEGSVEAQLIPSKT
jgi:hypothetical protein